VRNGGGPVPAEQRPEAGTGIPAGAPAGAGESVAGPGESVAGLGESVAGPGESVAGAEPAGPERAEAEAPARDGSAPAPAGSEPAGSEPAGSEPAGSERAEAEPPRPRGRRLSAAGAVIGVLLGLLGFALVVQLRSNATDTQLSSARTEDLVRILSDLDARKDRLGQEIAALEGTKQQLEAGSEGRAAALAEATRRAAELGILAGTIPAEGSGMTVRLAPGGKPLKAWMLVDTIEELRGAGAEAMQIAGADGPPVRLIASSYVVDAGTGVVVDGQALAAPYVITVIGDPQTMQPALNIAGGVVDTVHQASGTVIVQQGTVQVTAVRAVAQPRFAQPAN
jgi:uncharacterized protein YlxW (UPF0749 family)